MIKMLRNWWGGGGRGVFLSAPDPINRNAENEKKNMIRSRDKVVEEKERGTTSYRV
jgi:hypothetical protein